MAGPTGLALLGLLLGAASPAATGPAGKTPAGHYLDAPPLGHTGGFGEPTCRACHFDAPLNEAGGRLTVRGLPDGLGKKGGAAGVTVELVRPGMERAGLQLAARWASGERRGASAGRFEVDGERLEAAKGEEGDGVVYLRHTEAGSGLSAPDTARWRFRWVPPQGAWGPVVVHLAANAANDDASAFGDRIYADSVVIPASAPGKSDRTPTPPGPR